ncbi:MAG: nitroreductase family protein [Oscillospiraceae bacterium]|nr:nitroreductase family protein [Oscillospiraceae bacterium]
MKSAMSTILTRRSVYSLGKELPISEEKLLELISDCVKASPTSFNMQSPRVLVLLGEQHTLFWNVTLRILRAKATSDFAKTEKKIAGLAAGYGTIIYFEDQDTVAEYQQKFPRSAPRIPTWSEHNSAMLQYAIWTALAAEDIGASLHHYDPDITEFVKSQWSIPDSWSITGEMAFGSIAEPGVEKAKLDTAERMIIAR